MLHNNEKQKSLSRRFLLILGVVSFVCFLTLGSMLIFWDRFGLTKEVRWGFGAVVVIYGAIRFSRILRKPHDEE